MKSKQVFLAVSGFCLFGLVGGNAFVYQDKAVYDFASAEQKVWAEGLLEEPALLGTSRALRENVGVSGQYQNMAICQAADYVNIRQQPDISSAVVGKIHHYAAADIVAVVNREDGNWYQIQSGSVNGFVKAEYFLTGAQAETIASQIGTHYAAINTPALRLRAEPNTSSQTLTTLLQGAEYIMLGEENHFAKLSIDETLVGYVSMDYIKTRLELPQAVSLAEEAAQQAEEAQRKQEAQDALQKLEEVKLVEAKDFVSIPTAQVSQTSQNNRISQNSSTGQDSQSSQNSGTNQNGQSSQNNGTNQNSSSNQNSSTGQNGQSGTGAFEGAFTVAPNPLSQNDRQVAASEKSAANPTLSGVDITSPVSGSGNTLANISRNQYGVVGSGNGNAISYGPGGNASQAVVTATRTALVAYAKQFLGNPYVYGGSSLTNGTDCSGFVMRIFEHFGIDTGRNSREQAGNGRQIAIEAVQPGDLLFYASGNTINHVAIYIGGGQVIHAASAKSGIIISPSNYRTPCKAVSFLE